MRNGFAGRPRTVQSTGLRKASGWLHVSQDKITIGFQFLSHSNANGFRTLCGVARLLQTRAPSRAQHL